MSAASVKVDGEIAGAIGPGLLILLGVSKADAEQDADYLADRVCGLRIFPDEDGKMNRSVIDVSGSLLVVSQFTLYGDCRKGRRPSFDQAAPAEDARRLYLYFVSVLKTRHITVETGIFQAHMEVSLVNTGPVTLVLESS